jgi:chemotaxis protein methyltransferase CheR
MPFSHESLRLSEREFLVLRELIRERTGLFYDDSKRELLADRLTRRAVELGIETFIDYYYLLKYGPTPDGEWGRVLDALSVPETYFWREVEQIRALVDRIVPAHFARPGALPLRIWCAACATGEEPLSIAIALQDAGWFDRASIEILASDGSAQNVARARAGVYRDRAFRSLPPALRLKYFTPQENGLRIAETLHARIRWKTANLASAVDVAGCLPADVIFCRNVFIYFSPEAVRAVVEQFAGGLRRPGYLFVGISESLLRMTDAFDLEEIGGAFVYVPR